MPTNPDTNVSAVEYLVEQKHATSISRKKTPERDLHHDLPIAQVHYLSNNVTPGRSQSNDSVECQMPFRNLSTAGTKKEPSVVD